VGLTKSATLRQAKLLHEAGYGVVMYDHRNHGRSASDPVQKGMAERFTRDIVAAAQFAQDWFHPQLAVLAYGFSFSTFPSVYALRDSSAIGAVICDSGPCVDIDGLFDRFAGAGALPVADAVLANVWGRQMMKACVSTATYLLDPVWPPC
jgi:alpha-beta hydrolase superfamily lysophospholipase